MDKIKKIIVTVICWLIIIVADYGAFGIIGLFLMGYEDNYNISVGELWSMNTTEKILYICYYTWIILNIIGFLCIIVYIGRKIYKRIKN